MLSAIIALATAAAPALGRLLAGDRGEEIATRVVGVAQAVTGTSDVDAAARALADNPELALKFQQQAVDLALAEMEQETRLLADVNATMRAEYETTDKFRGRWRPWWGWVSGTAFGVQIFGLLGIGGYAVVFEPLRAGEVIQALAGLVSALTITWTVALSVLGVAVWKRSADKQGAAAALGSIMGKLGRK